MSEITVDEICPVCGYYCLGKGGAFCIDKPALLGLNKKGGVMSGIKRYNTEIDYDEDGSVYCHMKWNDENGDWCNYKFVAPIIAERDRLKVENRELQKIVHDYEIFQPNVTNKYLQKENERLREVIDKVYSDLQAKSKGANIQQISIIEYLGKAIEEIE